MVTVVCLDCEQPFQLENPPVKDVIITCPNCEAELEIISVEPLELDFYYEEDWDDDDEDWKNDEDLDDDDEDWEDD